MSEEFVNSGADAVGVLASPEPDAAHETEAMSRNRLIRLQTVTAALSGSLTPGDVADVIVEQGIAALGARAGAVVLPAAGDGDTLEIVRSRGYAEEDLAPWRHVTKETPLPIVDAIRTGQPVFIRSWDEFITHYPAARVTPPHGDSVCWAVVPLRVDDRTVGSIGLSFAQPRSFSDSDRDFMQTLGYLCGQALERARLYQEAHDARIRAETAQRHLSFLAEASGLLTSTLEYETTLANITRLAVPTLADWCAVDVLDEWGSLQRLAVAHVDPAKVEWARELHRKFPPDLNEPTGLGKVVRTGESEFYPEITQEIIDAAGLDEERREIIRQIGFSSYLCVPLNARGRILGALTLVTTTESGRVYGASDCDFAEDLGRRAGLAVDNARLFRAVEESEQRLSGILNASPFGIILSEFGGGILEANDAFLNLIGYTRDDLRAGRVRWDALTPPEQQERNLEAIRQLKATGACTPFEKEYIRKDGSRVPVLLGSARLPGTSDRTVTYVLDLSERALSAARLRESEARFEAMANAAPVLIWVSDRSALCTYFNRPWLDFTGRTMEQEIGEGWAEGIYPDDYRYCLSTYRSAFEARQPFEMEYRLRRYDREYRWVLDRGIPRYLPDGSFAGYIGSCIDITDRRNAEQALLANEARERAFFKDVLASVTEGRLRLCSSPSDLPERLTSAGETVALSPPSLRRLRVLARSAAEAMGFAEARIQELETAAGEAGMNAVVHAGGGRGSVYSGGAGVVQIWIEDEGKGIDMQRLPRATLERGFSGGSGFGHGFWLMLRMVDRIWLLTGPTGTTVVLEQDRTSPEPSWLAGRK